MDAFQVHLGPSSLVHPTRVLLTTASRRWILPAGRALRRMGLHSRNIPGQPSRPRPGDGGSEISADGLDGSDDGTQSAPAGDRARRLKTLGRATAAPVRRNRGVSNETSNAVGGRFQVQRPGARTSSGGSAELYQGRRCFRMLDIWNSQLERAVFVLGLFSRSPLVSKRSFLHVALAESLILLRTGEAIGTLYQQRHGHQHSNFRAFQNAARSCL